MPESAAAQSFLPLAVGSVRGPSQTASLGRVALLTNFIPPYRKPVLRALAERCRELKILVSTPMERNRKWDVDWSGLDVQPQKTVTFQQRWRHKRVDSEALYVHVPVDTIAVLRAFRPEVVVSVEMGMRTALAAAYRWANPDSRLLVWADCAESTEKGRGFSRTILRRLLRNRADGFLVNGASGARYLQTLGVARTRLFSVPYATDITGLGEFVIPRPDHLARRFLYAGQLIERKGLVPFLETLSSWCAAHPEQVVEFTIAGDGPVQTRLASMQVAANLRLRFLGNVPYERLGTVYQEAGVFVLPSFADTWALVVNEAMWAGLPVLGSVCAQAVEELVKEGVTGWRFDAEDSHGVYEAIGRCMSTSLAELQAMRFAAHQRASALRPEGTAELVVQAAMACQARGSS